LPKLFGNQKIQDATHDTVARSARISVTYVVECK